MFQHLDDPAPPAPDARQLRAVLGRARGLRRRARHRWATVTGVVAACAVVALVTTSIGPAATSGGHESAYQFNARTTPLAAGTPVPGASLTDVVFIGRSRGFALADHHDRLVLASTADGGSTWRVVNAHLPASASVSQGGTEMEFTSAADGYLWQIRGPAAATAPLWVTTDGGTSWTRAAIGPVVYDVSAIGANVWALAGSCPTAGASAPCSLSLEISTDAGRHWRAATGRVPAALPGRGSSFSVELARVSLSRAYVLAMDPGGKDTLSFTADGGTTWSFQSVPCAPPFRLGAELALSSTQDLWLVCGGPAGAGSQAKALYRSSNGGTSWSLRAETPPFGNAPAAPAGTGRLPLTGYVAPYSIGHKNLAVLSPHRAWLFATRGSVVTTTDGGAIWSPVKSLVQASFGSGAPGNITFIDATHGWVVELGVGVWSTSDGVTWHSRST